MGTTKSKAAIRQEETMTDELRIRANQLHSEIQNLEGLIKTLEKMQAIPKAPTLYHSEIGSVLLDKEYSDHVIDYIIDILKQQKEAKEDEYRML